MSGSVRAAVLAAVALVTAFGLLLVAPLDDDVAGLLTNCVNTPLLVWPATLCAARRCRAAQDPLWRTWALLTAGLLSWGGGQLVWTWYEEVLAREVPFPSWADVGYLGFPLCAVAALLLVPSGPTQVGSRLRVLLDGCLVAVSAFLVSWTTVLGTVYRAEAESAAALVIGLAYPLSELVVAVLVVLAVPRAPARSRPPLVVLAAGFGVLVVGDGAFLLGVYEGWYATGSVVDMTWVVGFSLVGVAGVMAVPRAGTGAGAEPTPTRVRALLPYLGLLPALGLVVLPSMFDDSPDRVEVVGSVVLLAVVVLRQLLVVDENHSLLVAVAARETQLRHQAFHDSLTGLANRTLFLERVEHAVALARRDLRPLAVLYVDLDDFKLVNDTLGHAEGDRLLVAVAERLRAAAGPAVTVGRLGGDEFALLLEDSGADVASAAERVAAALAPPFVLAERSVPVTASVGGVTLAGPRCATADAEQLLCDADAAMYVAKHAGKARYTVFTPDMRDALGEDRALRTALRQAVAAEAFTVAFQPLLDLRSGRVVGAEALARWRTDDLGDVPPLVFVPLAEELGLVPQLGRTVLRASVGQLRTWLRHDPATVLSVNVSPQELGAPGYAAGVLDVLREGGVPARNLVLEVTESAPGGDEQHVVTALEHLRAAGVRVAVDDVGTGWSSAGRLRRLPADIVKVDRSVLAGLVDDPRAAAVVGAVLDLARALGLDVVAEGIEDQAQLAALRALGCTTGQGYLLGRPGPAEAVTAQLAVPAPRTPVPAHV